MGADCNGGSKIHFARRMMHRALDKKTHPRKSVRKERSTGNRRRIG